MFALAEEIHSRGDEFSGSLPERISYLLKSIDTDGLMEVRLRCGDALTVVKPDGVHYITPDGKLTNDHKKAELVSKRDIKRGMELITCFSVYAHEEEMRNGYITIEGGHRVGICGEAVQEGTKISHIKTVQALNYRFAREVIGASDGIIDRICTGGAVKNTLIVSPPMRGKTTILRDLARNLSIMGKKVSIVDERSEIAAMYMGESPFDLGAGCDVLSNVRKSEGMLLMLRSMSPDVIITDEIGQSEDMEAIREIKKRGVSVITTLHGGKMKPCDFDLVIYLEGIGKCLEL